MELEFVDVPHVSRGIDPHGHYNRKQNQKTACEFVAWDGEGVKTTSGSNYALFGNSRGEYICKDNLSTEQCLEFMLNCATADRNVKHIGFAFDYDVNMILADLPRRSLDKLRVTGHTTYLGYRIHHVPHKWITVSAGDKKAKTYRSIRISDIFGFFQCSFLKAIKQYLPESQLQLIDIIESGKAERNTFTYDKIATIKEYWTEEIRLLELLADALQETFMQAGIFLKQWHGPGALAAYTYKRYNIQDHKASQPKHIRECAAYGYAGGRFELFKAGRCTEPIYSYDINSAYPAAIAKLPNLVRGQWRHTSGKYVRENGVAEFGIYRISMRIPRPFGIVPDIMPVFHRDSRGNISFPCMCDGWYWSPEAALVTNYIIEGYEWDWHGDKPFAQFVPEYYETRQQLKAEHNGAERAYKLTLNSLYGKMAQRVGWEHKGWAPTLHQLEWAGWVTSWTRAKLYRAMTISERKTIGVETDGFYTTATPDELGIESSNDLGAWKIEEYSELMYLQNGVYFLRDRDGIWHDKYRGLDPGTLDHDIVRHYLSTTKPDAIWPAITGPTTRFVGYKAALNSSDFDKEFRAWKTITRDLHPGSVGKRVHIPKWCPECRAGKSLDETMHTLIVNSWAQRKREERQSSPHFIPWEPISDKPEWLEVKDIESALL